MSPAETRAAILRNARAAERDRLRHEAIRRWGPLDGEALEMRVRELSSAKGAKGGHKGAAAVRTRLALARHIEATHAELLAQAEALVATIRNLLDVHATCEHIWPDDPGPNTYCQACGLSYDDWSQRKQAVA